MNFRKVFSVLFMSVLLLTQSFEVLAINYPKSFWALDSKYQSAVAANRYNDIINYGKQEIELMNKLPKEKELYGAIGARSLAVARAYEALGQYEVAVPYHKLYVECSEVMDWEEGIKISTAKVNAFTPTLGLYTLTDEPVKYYGAKYEPKTGTYFGQIYETSKRRDSMIIIYQEYGYDATLGWLNKALTDAEDDNKCVELALNFPGQGGQLDAINNDQTFINSFIDILKAHEDLKIYLRIGAEMNIWENKPDPYKYKQAFIKIATTVRNFCRNVAIVWSVGHTSPMDVEMEDFYPGDRYVDWVGVSGYGVKYFRARYWPDNVNEIYFKAGDGADPLRVVDEVISKYGDRKPIMISEGGSARYTNGEVNLAHEEWARLNLLRFYSTVCMKYPQVKLMGYFNRIMPAELQYFEMDSIPTIKNAYETITASPWFIQNGKEAAMSFKEITGTIEVNDRLEVYALPYVFKDQQPRVDYRIDGKWVGASSTLPYKSVLDLKGISPGNHTLEAVATSNGVEKVKKSYTIVKKEKPVQPWEFYDTDELSYEEKTALRFAVENGIIDGYDDGTFKPDKTITRAEFAVMVCRAFGYESDQPCKFTDAAKHWASKQIKACSDAGVISGVGDNKFSPDTHVLMAQASKILSLSGGFTDGKGVIYPKGYIYIANEKKLYQDTSFYIAALSVSDENKLSLQDLTEMKDYEISRIDVAVMFYNALNKK